MDKKYKGKMVQVKKCDCDDRIGVEINSLKLFEELKGFFNKQVENQIFKEILVEEPYFWGKDAFGILIWWANKWYKCNVCGCLWEFVYPEFPTRGSVRKFEDGIYKPEDYFKLKSEDIYGDNYKEYKKFYKKKWYRGCRVENIRNGEYF